MPTTRLPSSHSSRTWPALSIRCDAAPPTQPPPADWAGVFLRVLLGPVLPRPLGERLRFRVVLRADHEDDVALLGHRLDRGLAVLGGVTDVVVAGTVDRREALAQAR